MPIGSVPPNSTQAGAIEIKPASVASANWKYNQATSHYPYGDVYPPPAGGGPDPIYYELWYKFKPGTSFNLRTSPAIFSVVVKNIGSGAIRPTYAQASIVTVYDASNQVIVTGKVVEFTTNRNKDNWYYIKVVTAPIVAIAECFITIEFVEMPTYPVLVGAITVQEDVADSPLVFLPTAGGSNQLYTPKTMAMAEDNHSVHGGAGDILITGETCIQDIRANGVTLRDKNYVYMATAAIGTQVYYIKRNANGRNFWISYVNAPNNICRALEPDGSIGIPYFFPSPVIHLCAFDHRWLFYQTLGNNAIKVHDLVNNAIMPDLVATPVPYIGEVLDILATNRGTLLVNYYRPVGSSYQNTIREYHIPAGHKVSEWGFASNGRPARINYGEDLGHYYVWSIETSQGFGPSKPNTSFFRKIRIVDGLVVYTRGFNSFTSGALIDDQELYSNNSIEVALTQRFGSAVSSNFWVSPIQLDGGIGLLPPTWGLVPPDTEFPPGAPAPPYVFPPTTPPTLPVPEDIGGGIMILDPNNITRHDVYLGTNSVEINKPIPVIIRTAFIGD